jgi:hypothetical protein
MKKLFAILALALTGTAFAADFVSVDVDNVRGLKGATDSQAQYVRAGKSFGNYQLGLQSRTATVDGGGTLSSLEATVASNKIGFVGITPFVGVGHDNGFNGATGAAYTYGLVGATTGFKAGPGFALLGVKTRVGSDEAIRTKQTVAFATYSIPVAKNLSVNLNASKSYQTIKEDALGLGLSFNF